MADPLISTHDAIKANIDPEFSPPETKAVTEDVAPLQGYLAVDKPDGADVSKLEFIKKYIGKDSSVDTLYELRMIERKLANPKIGERRVDLVYNYLRAKEEADKSSKYLESFYE